MVSIPDWAKFSRVGAGENKADTVAMLNKYYKQREQETIRQVSTKFDKDDHIILSKGKKK